MNELPSFIKIQFGSDPFTTEELLKVAPVHLLPVQVRYGLAHNWKRHAVLISLGKHLARDYVGFIYLAGRRQRRALWALHGAAMNLL
jgi:hypothetical protein